MEIPWQMNAHSRPVWPSLRDLSGLVLNAQTCRTWCSLQSDARHDPAMSRTASGRVVWNSSVGSEVKGSGKLWNLRSNQ